MARGDAFETLRKAYLPWQYGMKLELPRSVGVHARRIVCLASGASRTACALAARVARVESRTPFTLREDDLTPDTLLVTLSTRGESPDVLWAWQKAVQTPVEHLVLTAGGALRREAKGRVAVLPLPDGFLPEVNVFAALPIILRVASLVHDETFPLDSVLQHLKRLAEADEPMRFAKHVLEGIGPRVLLGIAADDSPGLVLLEDALLSLSTRPALSLPLSTALHALPSMLRKDELRVDDFFFLFLREADEPGVEREAFEALREMLRDVHAESMTLVLKGSLLVRWVDAAYRLFLAAGLRALDAKRAPGEKPGQEGLLRRVQRALPTRDQ